ncbi:hypothetical protein [Sphingomonas sp.]|jgi:hypothetical protein|uniref:hypothetical protein n=1 Tax=Sphingomonas sp. TaxID=28214 RepID=UPI002E30ADAA|nr:hypothetical protein [Sphingomonas sp.]HEX4695661.1 hypothetical protein [Sphingomonas sp.]
MRLWVLALLIGLPSPVVAQDAPDQPADSLIHADLPLFGSGTKEMWPQHIDSSNGDIGCTSRVAFGIWRYRDTDNDEYDSGWRLVRNYGVFHCWAMFSSSEQRDDLPKAPTQPGFFVMIGKAGTKELWVTQIGARPGSDYVLLSRTPTKGIIKQFDVLQRDCPKSMRRDPPNLDILITKYCAINSRDDLLALARRMVKLPPLGTLTLVADVPKDKDSD